MELKEAQVGTKVKSLKNFSGVPKGTKGVIDQDYGKGVMVAWDLPDRPLPDNYFSYPLDCGRPIHVKNKQGFEVPILRDGFDKKEELQFLEILKEVDIKWQE